MRTNQIERWISNPVSIFGSEKETREAALFLGLFYAGSLDRTNRRSAERLTEKLHKQFEVLFTPANVLRALTFMVGDRRYSFLGNGDADRYNGFQYFLIEQSTQSGEMAFAVYQRMLGANSAAPRILSRDRNDLQRNIGSVLLPFFAQKFRQEVGGIHPITGGQRKGGVELLFGYAPKNEEALLVLMDVCAIAKSYHGVSSITRTEVTAKAIDRMDAYSKEHFLDEQLSRAAWDERLEARLPQLLALSEALWEDILRTARADIRRGGFDRFAVLAPNGRWRSEGYFLREGIDFPQIGVVDVTEHMSGGKHYLYHPIFTHEGMLCELESLKADRLPVGEFVYHRICELLAYHHYVCRPAKESPAGQTEDGIPVLDDEAATRKLVEVRAHMKRLPEGWQPSDEARERARALFGRELPEGFTFVRAHQAGRSDFRSPAGYSVRETENASTIEIDLSAVFSWIE